VSWVDASRSETRRWPVLGMSGLAALGADLLGHSAMPPHRSQRERVAKPPFRRSRCKTSKLLDIYRIAKLLMQPHGADNAKLFAAERADKLLAKADPETLAASPGGFAGT
jgi:hypothetical protein